MTMFNMRRWSLVVFLVVGPIMVYGCKGCGEAKETGLDPGLTTGAPPTFEGEGDGEDGENGEDGEDGEDGGGGNGNGGGGADSPLAEIVSVVSSIVEKNAAGSAVAATVFQYDDQGRLIDALSNNADDEVWHTTLTYDGGRAYLTGQHSDDGGTDNIEAEWILDDLGRRSESLDSVQGAFIGGLISAFGSIFGGDAPPPPDMLTKTTFQYDGVRDRPTTIKAYFDANFNGVLDDPELANAGITITELRNARGQVRSYRMGGSAGGGNRIDFTFDTNGCANRVDVIRITATRGGIPTELLQDRNEFECTFSDNQLTERKEYRVTVTSGVAGERTLQTTITYSYDSQGRLASESHVYEVSELRLIEYSYLERPRAPQIFRSPFEYALQGVPPQVYSAAAVVVPTLLPTW